MCYDVVWLIVTLHNTITYDTAAPYDLIVTMSQIQSYNESITSYPIPLPHTSPLCISQEYTTLPYCILKHRTSLYSITHHHTALHSTSLHRTSSQNLLPTHTPSHCTRSQCTTMYHTVSRPLALHIIHGALQEIFMAQFLRHLFMLMAAQLPNES